MSLQIFVRSLERTTIFFARESSDSAAINTSLHVSTSNNLVNDDPAAGDDKASFVRRTTEFAET